uniref:Expansin-like EG45 domain-containing protein n=1 Tax=Globisporangium ultimum (strain ATCC 200006 / CBS 805.95 / DAOM BR144) TaxID=431595 RepID=K3X0Q7_GLOUD
MAWTLALLVTGALGFARADDYFRGDGTAYTLGSTSAGNCNMMAANSDAGANYAAINNPQWDGMKSCGRCAEVSCDDARCTSTSSQVVQILDRCPECKSGDLDLSPSVFKMITGSDPARLSIKWKFVDCPSQGNIKFCLKGGSNNFWTAIQPANFVSGVTSMTVNGKATTMVDSAYYYLLDGNSQVQTDLSSVKVKLTSVSGEVVQDTVSLTAEVP